MKEKMQKTLMQKTLAELTELLNQLSPFSTDVKMLKCKKEVAVEKVIDQALIVRKKRNKKAYKKLSRRLLVYCR